MQPLDGNRCIELRGALRQGGRLSYAAIQELGRVRIFYLSKEGVRFCTCPSFAKQKQSCLHTIALRVHAGLDTCPPELDPLALAVPPRGRKRKAGNRYAMQEVAQVLRRRLRQKTSPMHEHR